jgi:hypothetical protein
MIELVKDRYSNNKNVKQDDEVFNNYTFFSENFERIKKNYKIVSDIDKKNAILVEDSIFNLAFKQSGK